MVDPHGDGPDDWFFDEHQRRWLRHSGVARWRTILAENAANRDLETRAALLKRLGLDPNRPARRLFRAPRPSGYPGVMRRPDIELTDEAAAFVEQHPDVIARLAGEEPTTTEPAVVGDDARRARFREYIRERRAAAATPEAAEGARAFLARYSG
jgi:hypothetical protein